MNQCSNPICVGHGKRITALRANEKEWRDLERLYSQQLGEMTRLADVVCKRLQLASDLLGLDQKTISALGGLMEYIEAVRPPAGSKDPEWVMHIIGPDDVIDCVSQFDALRKANQHNKAFAKLMETDPSPNDPYCVALAKNRAVESV